MKFDHYRLTNVAITNTYYVIFHPNFITFLSDMGPHNITVGCQELNLNMNLPMQPFQQPIIYVLRAHKTRVER